MNDICSTKKLKKMSGKKAREVSTNFLEKTCFLPMCFFFIDIMFIWSWELVSYFENIYKIYFLFLSCPSWKFMDINRIQGFNLFKYLFKNDIAIIL